MRSSTRKEKNAPLSVKIFAASVLSAGQEFVNRRLTLAIPSAASLMDALSRGTRVNRTGRVTCRPMASWRTREKFRNVAFRKRGGRWTEISPARASRNSNKVSLVFHSGNDEPDRRFLGSG